MSAIDFYRHWVILFQLSGEIIWARHEIPTPARHSSPVDACQTAYQSTFRAWYHQYQNMGTLHLLSSSTMESYLILNLKDFCLSLNDYTNVKMDVGYKNLVIIETNFQIIATRDGQKSSTFKSSPDNLNDICPTLIWDFCEISSYHRFHMQIQLGRWPAYNMKKLRRTFAECQGWKKLAFYTDLDTTFSDNVKTFHCSKCRQSEKMHFNPDDKALY